MGLIQGMRTLAVKLEKSSLPFRNLGAYLYNSPEWLSLHRDYQWGRLEHLAPPLIVHGGIEEQVLIGRVPETAADSGGCSGHDNGAP